MLAVKHIQLSGHEEIYLTNRVSYEPNFMPTNTAGVSGRPYVWLDGADKPSQQLDGGTVFVMNEMGKTVTRYDLGASMVPLSQHERD